MLSSNNNNNNNNKQFALTTMDNPYDPLDDFIHWFMFDIEKGYNTCGYLGRVARFSDDMTDVEENEEIERAINQIVYYDPIGLYKKVTKENINT